MSSLLLTGWPAREQRTCRCWLVQLDQPYRCALRLVDCHQVRYAVINQAGVCYLELTFAARRHWLEEVFEGRLLKAESKPVGITRDAARALVEAALWELGEWSAGGRGARSDLVPFLRVPVVDVLPPDRSLAALHERARLRAAASQGGPSGEQSDGTI